MAMKLDYIIFHLSKVLRKDRFEHVLRVRDTALLLNEELNLGLDEEKVEYAAILHDCAKDLEREYFEKFKDEYILKEEEVFEVHVVSHAILGQIAASEVYGVYDEDILDAIRWHTTAKENMSLLTKLIFIADFIEPGRTFDEAEIVRKEIRKDLDKGLLLCLDLQIKHLVNINAIIDLETIKARNYLQRRVNE